MSLWLTGYDLRECPEQIKIKLSRGATMLLILN